MLKDMDFGVYGKGIDGYIHYSLAMDRIQEEEENRKALMDEFDNDVDEMDELDNDEDNFDSDNLDSDDFSSDDFGSDDFGGDDFWRKTSPVKYRTWQKGLYHEKDYLEKNSLRSARYVDRLRPVHRRIRCQVYLYQEWLHQRGG